jgi:hypothetical protein
MNDEAERVCKSTRQFSPSALQLKNVSLSEGMLFGVFYKCLYPAQKFDSDTEGRFAIILEDEGSVTKWLNRLRKNSCLWVHLVGAEVFRVVSLF